MSPVQSALKDNLANVEDRIHAAVARCGRRREEITLVAVTKVFPASVILEGWELGLRDFGENYVQEFEGKSAEVSHLPGARFHLIGHLQSNKAKRAAELFDVVETVDSAKLAKRLDSFSKPLDIFLEVKLSPEGSKSGADPEEIADVAEAVRSCSNLSLRGLMTMPPWSDDPEPTRPYFARLRELGDVAGVREFSMGMSHDFEVAIEEGATHIRVGTALFGRRKKA